MIVRLILAALAAVALSGTAAAARDTGFLDRTVRVAGAEHRYQVYVPRGYRAADRLPVILALHGGGERGADGILQTEVGLGSALRRHADRYPAVVVFPQVPLEGSWQGASADVALAALEQATREFRADRSRTYLAGMSMGGNGSWYLLNRDPQRFAAAVVICSFVQARGTYPAIAPGGDPYTALAQRVAGVPLWIAHGDADTVVPVDESRRMVAALRTAGARDVRYVELPGVGHNSWDPTFRNPEMTAWLFAQRRR